MICWRNGISGGCVSRGLLEAAVAAANAEAAEAVEERREETRGEREVTTTPAFEFQIGLSAVYWKLLLGVVRQLLLTPGGFWGARAEIGGPGGGWLLFSLACAGFS